MMIMRDINFEMPNLPDWIQSATLFNWELSYGEITNWMRSNPIPDDHKWHHVIRHNKDMIVDGKVIRQSDESKLT